MTLTSFKEFHIRDGTFESLKRQYVSFEILKLFVMSDPFIENLLEFFRVGDGFLVLHFFGNCVDKCDFDSSRSLQKLNDRLSR